MQVRKLAHVTRSYIENKRKQAQGGADVLSDSLCCSKLLAELCAVSSGIW